MKHTTWSSGLSVTADGTGVVAHAGSVAVRLLADRTGLTAELSKALTRASFIPVHDRGRVQVDVAVMLADGGEACMCDLVDAFELSQPTISHHLKVVHEVGLLSRDKRGVWVH